MAEPKHSYAMGRDSHASGRLTLQHMLLKDQWSLIHPTITTSWSRATTNNKTDSSTPLKIADMACGNAIWATEVAESNLTNNTNIQVIGFDISTAQFPPRDNWPSNLTLETGNMFKPPPKEYEGFFDLVNIRLVMIALRDGDPRPVLHNLLKLLKPGGHLQWTEVDLLSSAALPEDSEYRNVGPLITRAGGPHSFRWISELGAIFEDAGLQDVEFERRLPRKSMEKFFVDNNVMAITEMARGMRSEEIDAWLGRTERERVERGVAVLWESVLVVGRKGP